VQGSSQEDRELLDAQALVVHLVPAASVFEFLDERRGSVLPDEAFSNLFPSRTGRPSIPPDVTGSVLVLPVSDRETVEALPRWCIGGVDWPSPIVRIGSGRRSSRSSRRAVC
jgi:hypothetical protein